MITLHPLSLLRVLTSRLTRSKAELKFKVAAELVVLEKTMLASGLGGSMEDHVILMILYLKDGQTWCLKRAES